MKKIVQNITLLTALFTAISPLKMKALEKRNDDFNELEAAIKNDGLYGPEDKYQKLSDVDDSVTPTYEQLRKIESSNAQVLIDIINSNGTTSKQKIRDLEKALKTINVMSKKEDGKTALYWASLVDLEIVTYLVEQGADVNAEANEGTTPIFNAVFRNNLEMTKYFVEHGAEINVECGHYADTPLQWAASINKLELVKYLVKHGADLSMRNRWGYTAIESTKKQQLKDFLKLAEDFHAVNKKEMGFDEFAKDYLINPNAVEYTDAEELLKAIEATTLNPQTLENIKKHLDYVELTYETDNKLKEFANYAEKYLSHERTVRYDNLTDVYDLLHLGTREFFDAFVKFIKQHNALTFNGEDGNEKEWILFDLASRPSQQRDFWFKECFWLLGEKETSKSFSELVDKLINKLPIKERDRLTKEKNKILQQKKGYLAIPQHLRMPNITAEKMYGDAPKKKILDLKIWVQKTV